MIIINFYNPKTNINKLIDTKYINKNVLKAFSIVYNNYKIFLSNIYIKLFLNPLVLMIYQI